jgi:hypothetical protein
VGCLACAQASDPAALNTGIRQSVRHMHMLGVIAPFAAASSGANTFLLLTKAMAKFIKVPAQASPRDTKSSLL